MLYTHCKVNLIIAKYDQWYVRFFINRVSYQHLDKSGFRQLYFNNTTMYYHELTTVRKHIYPSVYCKNSRCYCYTIRATLKNARCSKITDFGHFYLFSDTTCYFPLVTCNCIQTCYTNRSKSCQHAVTAQFKHHLV